MNFHNIVLYKTQILQKSNTSPCHQFKNHLKKVIEIMGWKWDKMEIFSGNWNKLDTYIFVQSLFSWILFKKKERYNKNVIIKFNPESRNDSSIYQMFSFILFFALLCFKHSGIYHSFTEKKNQTAVNRERNNFTTLIHFFSSSNSFLAFTFLFPFHFIYLCMSHIYIYCECGCV